MLSCKEVCYLVSESLDRQLPWHKRLGMRIHLSMCAACRRLVQQMDWLRVIANNYSLPQEGGSQPEPEPLSEKAKSRIRTRLQQAREDSTGHQ